MTASMISFPDPCTLSLLTNGLRLLTRIDLGAKNGWHPPRIQKWTHNAGLCVWGGGLFVRSSYSRLIVVILDPQIREALEILLVSDRA